MNRYETADVRFWVWPLVAALAALLVTWFMYSEAVRFEAGDRLRPAHLPVKLRFLHAGMQWIERQVGSTGVLIAGGVAFLGCLGWLAYSITKPPAASTAKPKA